jgi:two-component system sensor histidine kinase UhpB
VAVILDEVRQVARRLRPGVLDDLGLESALHALVADFTKSTGLAATLRIHEQLPLLDGPTELVIYRLAQESLTNIARHAAASRAEVVVTTEGGDVVLLVADDGAGFDAAAEGAGIRGMRERAVLIGAQLAIDSTLGRGTRIQMIVPQPGGRR